MANVEVLRNKCKEIHQQRQQEVELILTDWLELFISTGHAWRAVTGNKKCKPIPIHKYFRNSDRLTTTYDEYKKGYNFRRLNEFRWPDIPEKEIFEIIESLGFIICTFNHLSYTLANMCLVVPDSKKGQPLTFAQKWVRKINHAYSEYIVSEKNLAKNYYESMVSQLCDVPYETIQIYDGYALFKGFEFNSSNISLRCARYVRTMMHKDGLKELYENREYKGICVFYDPPQP